MPRPHVQQLPCPLSERPGSSPASFTAPVSVVVISEHSVWGRHGPRCGDPGPHLGSAPTTVQASHTLPPSQLLLRREQAGEAELSGNTTDPQPGASRLPPQAGTAKSAWKCSGLSDQRWLELEGAFFDSQPASGAPGGMGPSPCQACGAPSGPQPGHRSRPNPCCFPLLLGPQCCKGKKYSQENPFPVARVCGVSLPFHVLGP